MMSHELLSVVRINFANLLSSVEILLLLVVEPSRYNTSIIPWLWSTEKQPKRTQIWRKMMEHKSQRRMSGCCNNYQSWRRDKEHVNGVHSVKTWGYYQTVLMERHLAIRLKNLVGFVASRLPLRTLMLHRYYPHRRRPSKLANIPSMVFALRSLSSNLNASVVCFTAMRANLERLMTTWTRWTAWFHLVVRTVSFSFFLPIKWSCYIACEKKAIALWWISHIASFRRKFRSSTPKTVTLKINVPHLLVQVYVQGG